MAASKVSSVRELQQGLRPSEEQKSLMEQALDLDLVPSEEQDTKSCAVTIKKRIPLALTLVAALLLAALCAAMGRRSGGEGAELGQAAIKHEVKKAARTTHNVTHEKEEDEWVYRNARPGEPWPSLFCWSHIEEHGSERDLLSSQLMAKFGIFSCNEFCVISRSQDRITLGPHPSNKSKMVRTWTNFLPPDVKGNPSAGDATASYKNARTFLTAWKTLFKSTILWSHDWIVKADPDAVFYPERLRWHVASRTKPPAGPGPFYILNCDVDGGRLYGSLEVFAVRALQEMDKRGYECEDMPYDKWGEDLYMEKCMEHLNGPRNAVRDFQLVGDERCTKGACTDGYRAAFHPMPNVGSYWACAAAGGRRS